MRLLLALLTAGIVLSASCLALVSAAADQACTSDELAALATIATAQSGLLHDCETQSGYTLYPFTDYPTTVQQSVVCIGRSCPNVISNFQQAAALPECLVTVDGQQMTTIEFLDTICDVRTPTPTPTTTPTATSISAPTSTPTPSSPDSSPSPSPPSSSPQTASGSSVSVPSETPTSDNESSNSTALPSTSASTSTSAASANGSSTASTSASGSEDLSIEPLSSSSSSVSADVSSSIGSDAESAADTPEPTVDGAGRSSPELLLTALAVCALAIADL